MNLRLKMLAFLILGFSAYASAEIDPAVANNEVLPGVTCGQMDQANTAIKQIMASLSDGDVKEAYKKTSHNLEIMLQHLPPCLTTR